LLRDGPGAAYDARGPAEPPAATGVPALGAGGSIKPSNVVFAALPESSLAEDRAGWSIRKIVRTVTGLVANGYLPRAKTLPR
jgi:hypothetical protein